MSKMSKDLINRPTVVPTERESARKIKATIEDAKLICVGIREVLHECGPIIEELDLLLWRSKGLLIALLFVIETLIVLTAVLLLRHV